jgi:hypothetical protein
MTGTGATVIASRSFAICDPLPIRIGFGIGIG